MTKVHAVDAQGAANSPLIQTYSKEIALQPMVRLIILTLLLLASWNSNAKTAIEFVGALDNDDDYQVQLLRKALDATISTHGYYSLELRPQASDSREVKLVADHPSLNRISVTPKVYEHIHNSDIRLITIPISRGIMGYRVCYSATGKAKALEEAFENGDFKKLRFGSGYKWSDSDIMRFNGMKVVESGWDMNISSTLESLYKMTAHGRINVFCRGVNEIEREQAIVNNIKGLSLNKSHILFYNMPFFYYVHAKNDVLFQRIELGLNILLENGEFEKLWNQYHLESIKNLKIFERKLIRLKSQEELYDNEHYRAFLFVK